MRRLVLPALLLLAGCFGSTPEPPRYFEPVTPPREAASPLADNAKFTVRLRNVEGGLFLADRIVWRTSTVERGLHDLERWTEPPATYVWRSLGLELYERRGLTRGGPDADHTIDCEVRAFEEVLLPEHQAHVAVWLQLYSKGGTTILERTFDATRPVGEESPSAMARAMGEALAEVTAAAGEAVVAALRAP